MEKQRQKIGKSSIALKNAVYIKESASIVGKKESEGPLGNLFDMAAEDDLFGCNTWEEAESTMQKEAITLALGKAALTRSDISYVFAGDLLGQCTASSFGNAEDAIPYIGVYGACSTCGLGLGMASVLISAGFAENAISVTSSHFAGAEKEFRYPLAYGNQRPPSSTWTVTGAAAFVVTSLVNKRNRAEITGITTGKIVDYGLKDSMNMGACMAPAASDLIYQHLLDFGRVPADYDRIITGDLGKVGQRAMLDLLKEKGIDIEDRHMDCGIEIYTQNQGTESGGSGCGCSAVTLSAYILKMLEEGKWKRVLFIPTGALLSKTSFNEGRTIPGIAHGIVLESCKDMKM